MKRAMTARRRAGVRGVLTVAAAVTFLVAAAVPVLATPHPFGVGDWAMGGHDPLDSRSNPTEHVLNPRDVNQLAVKWTYKAHGDVSATPAVVGGAIYFTD